MMMKLFVYCSRRRFLFQLKAKVEGKVKLHLNIDI